MEVRALTQSEQKYTYAQSMQLEGQTGCIGHLRGDFDTSGYGFHTTWFDTREQWKTDEFKTGLDDVINTLREDKGLLHNRYDMGAFTKQFPDSGFNGNYCTEYGFRVDTESDGSIDHVGIVEKCENGTVYTVEGNSGDACKQQSYPVGSGSIYGYGCPNY